jgi:dienelactone hydrolase
MLSAAGPRILPADKLPQDRRLQPLKTLDGYFPFTPAASREAWEQRAEQVRRQILVSQGLWPMPEKKPLNAVIHGKVERPGYTVERVYFESFPGFFVTGSLYRPTGKTGPMPGVLCPHGHWREGRFHEWTTKEVRDQIVRGAERFEAGGRAPLQARCVQLARMGCVVFHYDMLGYADSNQLSYELVHRFAKQRPEMNQPENWGLYSPQAESHCQSVMGLQTWNSIRSLDFLLSLPEVYAKRIGVTGASGGGTQTFILGAIDTRPTVAFPAVMVSTAMQGGCTCENSCQLRIDTGNVEFAALFAPKPLGLTAADDWTKAMPTKGYPELQKHFSLLGAEKNVSLTPLLHFEHNYNYVSRGAMYKWFNKHFQLGIEEPVVEEDFQRLSKAELTVWNEKHPQPVGGEAFERQLLAAWKADADRQLAAAQPNTPAGLQKFQAMVVPAWEVLIGRKLPTAKELTYDQSDKVDQGDWIRMGGLLRNTLREEELPVRFFYPKKWNGRVAIWLSDQGKEALCDDAGQPAPLLRELLQSGTAVASADLIYQGEFLAPGTSFEKTPRVGNPREAAPFTFGYNPTIFAQRVHDVLSLIAFSQGHDRQPKRIDLIALDPITAPVAAAARLQAGDALGKCVINTHGFRFGKVTDLHDVRFQPGGAKYADLPGLLAAAGARSLLLAGEPAADATWLSQVYKAENKTQSLEIFSGEATSLPATARQFVSRE